MASLLNEYVYVIIEKSSLCLTKLWIFGREAIVAFKSNELLFVNVGTTTIFYGKKKHFDYLKLLVIALCMEMLLFKKKSPNQVKVTMRPGRSQ